VLFPLSKKATITQLKIKELDKGVNEIKEKYKNNKEEQAKAMMAYYKENGVNPFSGIILLFIQIPILLSLYFMVLKGLPQVDTSILYSFVNAPTVDMHFVGSIDLAGKSFILALLAAVTQYIQVHFAMPLPPPKKGKESSFKDDFARSMNLQMRFFMPALIFIILFPFPPFSYIFPAIPSVIALYWITSNVFAIGQELYLRKTIKNKRKEEISIDKSGNLETIK